MRIITIIICFIVVMDNKLILAAMMLTYNNNTIELFIRSVINNKKECLSSNQVNVGLQVFLYNGFVDCRIL